MSKHLTFDVLSRMVEHTLLPLDEGTARRHLARCGPCRSELAWLGRLRARPPYFRALEPAPELVGLDRRARAGADEWRTDSGDGTWRINRAWLAGSNRGATTGWQRRAG